MGQWLGSDVMQLATFHADTVMETTEDFISVMTQKDRV
jgi:hypothetical protein